MNVLGATLECPWSCFGIAAATIAAEVLGFIIYGPVFGAAWREALVKDKNDPKYFDKFQAKAQKEGAAKVFGTLMGIDLVCQAVKFTILAHFLAATHTHRLIGGAIGGFWAFVGFELTHLWSHASWENRPMIIRMISIVKDLSASMIGGMLLVWFMRFKTEIPAAA